MKNFTRVAMRGKMSLKSRWQKWNKERENTWYKFVGMSVLVAFLSFSAQAIYTIATIDHEVPVVSVARAEAVPTLSMRDYVLNEVEKAGLDKYKVYTLIQCESRWNDQATNINKGGALGIDRGLWQISDKFHKEVSNSCAYDYVCSTREAIRILKQKGFREWSCGKSL